MLARYSNQPHLLRKLADVLRRTAEGERADVAGIVDRVAAAPRLAQDRLTSGDVAALIADFQAGTCGCREGRPHRLTCSFAAPSSRA